METQFQETGVLLHAQWKQAMHVDKAISMHQIFVMRYVGMEKIMVIIHVMMGILEVEMVAQNIVQ